MAEISTKELVLKAAEHARIKGDPDSIFDDVGCALETEGGNVYVGSSIGAGCGIGHCAEHYAIGSMVTKGETKIRRIVAVWRNKDNKIYIVPPCGVCREFMYLADVANLDTNIIVGNDKTVLLRELLPYPWRDGFIEVI